MEALGFSRGQGVCVCGEQNLGWDRMEFAHLQIRVVLYCYQLLTTHSAVSEFKVDALNRKSRKGASCRQCIE